MSIFQSTCFISFSPHLVEEETEELRGVLSARDTQPGNGTAGFESGPSGCRHHAQNHHAALSPTFLCVLVLLVHFEMGWHCIATAVPVQSALQVPKKAWGKTMRNMSGCYLRSPVRQLRLKKIWLSWVDKTYDKWQTVEMPGEQQFQ